VSCEGSLPTASLSVGSLLSTCSAPEGWPLGGLAMDVVGMLLDAKSPGNILTRLGSDGKYQSSLSPRLLLNMSRSWKTERSWGLNSRLAVYV
jgi:hypothetical protein